MKLIKFSDDDKKEAIAELKRINPSKVYDRVVKVSPSGMSRHISFYIPAVSEIDDSLIIVDLTRIFSKIAGLKYSHDLDTLFVEGCGMDMCNYVARRVSESQG